MTSGSMAEPPATVDERMESLINVSKNFNRWFTNAKKQNKKNNSIVSINSIQIEKRWESDVVNELASEGSLQVSVELSIT